MPTPKALRTRQTLLTVARTIILNEGIGALTMDKVAEAAGVSKGACMYHFKSKRALQAALLEDYAEHLNTELERHEAMFEGTPDETLVPGYIEWFKSFDTADNGWARVGVALLSNFSHDAELMQPVRDWYEKLYARINALPDDRRAETLVAIMALEGFFYTHKFGVDLAGSIAKRKAWDCLKKTLVKTPARRR